MATTKRHARTPLAAAALCALSCSVLAQTAQTITVTGRQTAGPAIGGFGDVPLARSPLQANVYGSSQLADAGVASLADLTRLDAGLSDAYNAEGYWSFLSARGFVLDNKYNYRRDGLPINAETALALQNKDRIEVLKGTSGIQAGTSAPGGLVNLVVKRPVTQLRSATLEWRERGTVSAAVDLSERFGPDGRFGLRLNAAATKLLPETRHADGDASLAALAGDWQVGATSRLEAEIEHSRQKQPSVPGFSLLGGTLPDAGAVDPRTNLNNQPWSLPMVMAGTTASLRWQQLLGDDWKLVAHAATQRLRSDDRVAFPFGCAAKGVFDRYCSNGTFDFYAFQSDNERRDTDALGVSVDGKLVTAGMTHRLGFGVVGSRFRSRLEARVDDGTIVGTGSIDGTSIIPVLPPLGLVPNTNLDERSTELFVRDHVEVTERLGLWAGVRHTRLSRSSVRTDNSAPTDYSQSFSTPWLAASYAITPATFAYASWGEGVESEVVPNRARYVNAGQALPALKSRQVEAGLKGNGGASDWSVVAFQVTRPQAGDFGACVDPASCTRAIDGRVRHRGVEGSAGIRFGAWALSASAMWLDAERAGAADPAANGRRPTNVPETTLKLRASHDLGAMPGLTLAASLVHEGSRMVLPDNSIELPGWTRVDLGARLATTLLGRSTVLRLSLDNAFDRRAWRESPYQFGHSYLFPLPARTWRASLQVAL